jgi:mRNA deadenylase 3'-5' endonuclease subunit Ccr4
MKTTINCSTYNVLANSMATKDFFQVEKDEYLELSNRMPKILNSIDEMITNDSIIALQEVDIKLAASGLHQKFIDNNYYPLTAHYSTMESRDYFGNVIAFPTKLYKLITYGQVKIGSLISAPENRTEAFLPLFNRKVDHDVYTEAMKRDTCLLYVVLEDKNTNKRFVVSTYHMPCTFWWPGVMTLHVDTLLKQIDILKQDLPCILLGDFNAKQYTPVYNYITQCIMDESYYPLPNWEKSDNLQLTDARIAVNYPLIPTTKCKNKNGDLFCEILDYIFVSKEFEVTKFDQKQTNEIMPNLKEGSDHLPIHARLLL